MVTGSHQQSPLFAEARSGETIIPELWCEVYLLTEYWRLVKSQNILYRMNDVIMFLIKLKVTDQFFWFSIASEGLQMNTKYPNLNKIGQKLQSWECCVQKMQNGHHGVIKLRYPKFQKKTTLGHVLDNISVFVRIFIKIGLAVKAVKMSHRHTQTRDTYTQLSKWLNIKTKQIALGNFNIFSHISMFLKFLFY